MEIYNYSSILDRGVGYTPIGRQYSNQQSNPVSPFTDDSNKLGDWTYFEIFQENEGESLRTPCPDLSSFSKTLKVEEMIENDASRQGPANMNYRIRLLASTTQPRKSDSEEDLFPIPCSQETFERVSNAFLLPKSYLETLYRGATVFLQFPPGYTEICGSARGYIFHNTSTRLRNFGAAISFQHKEKIINAFIHGLVQDEIDDLLYRLKQYHHYFAFPSLLPAILLELRLDISTRNSRWTFEKIQQIERETGLDPGWQYTLRSLPFTGVDITKIDYARTTHNLTAISARVAHYAMICKIHADMPDELDAINTEFMASIPLNDERKALMQIMPFLQARINHSRLYLKATLARVENLESRLQCQRDTLFSFVAQRDNLLNSRIADQSLFLANITFWFLPATFLATFFSTSFFEFSAGPPKMSPWIWVYFVISICMTILVYIGWWFKSKKEEKDDPVPPKPKYGSDDNI